MIFKPATLKYLLGSIEANRLVLFCGAGLSMPAPSSLMSAVNVSRRCYDDYQIETLPANLRDDIEALAGYFLGTGQFESVFIDRLVPWSELVGEPNTGHAAVADFLICHAAAAALSANFDALIEHWACQQKVPMRGSLTAQEAIKFPESAPLLKFHGCVNRSREQTLWTQGQLSLNPVKDRIESCSDWMKLHLPGKDLLVVGFWSDWGYLNDALASAMATAPFGSVTVIDPLSSADLEAKAPVLWTKLTTTSKFEHVKGYGEGALEELRIAFSKTWAKKFYQLGRPMFQDAGGTYSVSSVQPHIDIESDALYNLRRDAEGRPYNRAAQKKEPPTETAQAAFFHLLLIHANAPRKGSWYTYGGKTIRVVHGGGQHLATVREGYKEPPSVAQADITVCAGAMDLVVPAKVVATGSGSSIVRTASGGGSRWLTLDQARSELGL
jgi:hypothetical protein